MLSLDFIQKNFPKGKLTTVFGRPASGKTSFGISLAMTLVEAKHDPVFFSMEAKKENVVSCAKSLIEDAPSATKVEKLLIDDTPTCDVNYVRQVVESNGADFVIIDYLQLMNAGECLSREEETNKILDELNALAAERKISVVVFSQLSFAQAEAFSYVPEDDDEYPDYEDDFEFEEDKEAYTIDTNGHVEIQDTQLGIRNLLFKHRKDIKSIHIPDSVEEIGILTFQDCTGLTEIYIPDSVMTIKKYAFSDCSNLKLVRVKKLQLLNGTRISEKVLVITN